MTLDKVNSAGEFVTVNSITSVQFVLKISTEDIVYIVTSVANIQMLMHKHGVRWVPLHDQGNTKCHVQVLFAYSST